MFKYKIEYQQEDSSWAELENWTRPFINKSTLDETHDETQVFVVGSKIDTPFRPFTKFIISIEEYNDENILVNNDTLYRVVIADEMKQLTFDGEKLYDHDIRLAEASKELERYTVDNLSFTNYWAKVFQQTDGTNGVVNNVIYQDWFNNAEWYNVGRLNTGASVSAIISRVPFFRNGDWLVSENYGNYNSFLTYVNYGISSIYETRIGQLASEYQNFYNFNSKVSNQYPVGNTITLPTLSASNIPTTQLALSDKLFPNPFRRYAFYAEFSTSVENITIIKPNEETEVVSQGSNYILEDVGEYKLRFTINRSFRMRRDRYKPAVSGDPVTETIYGQWQALSTLTIEQPVYSVDTLRGDISKMSIYDVLTRLVSLTPTRFNEGDTQKFFIDTTLQAKYGITEAPETIITGKNLWEALLIIGGQINAIPYLKINDKYNWNTISFFPLSSEEPTADTVEEEYSNSTSYYSSDSYTGSYDVMAENLINPLSTKEGQISESGFFIGKTPRSEEVEISSTNFEIETRYPIYRVNSLKAVRYNKDGLKIKTYDLSIYVNESTIYNALPSVDTESGKAISLYFSQGKKNIKGLFYKVSKNELENAENVVAIKYILQRSGYGTVSDNDIINTKFIVEYIPFLNSRLRYYKTNAPKLRLSTTMWQNQTSNVVDTIALGRKMVANLGRTANLGYVDSINVYSLNRVPLKGQRSKDGYFVATITTEYDQEHLLASIEYTKDYQRISEWINIFNLQRYAEVSEKQSIDRYINTNMFYIFGDPVGEINKQFGLRAGVDINTNYLHSLLLGSTQANIDNKRVINASMVKCYSYNFVLTSDLVYKADVNYYTLVGDRYDRLVVGVDYTIGEEIPQPNTTIYSTELELSSNLYLNSNAISTGNNISIITDFYDNYGAGNQAVDYSDAGTQAYMNRAVPYANEFGQIDRLHIDNVTDNIYEYSLGTTELEENMTKLGKLLPSIQELVDLKPSGTEYIKLNSSASNYASASSLGSSQDIYIRKDSREAIHINQQFHFLKNRDDIIVGSGMTEKYPFIQQNVNNCRLVFLNDTIDDYEFRIKESDIVPISIIPEGELEYALTEDTQFIEYEKYYTKTGDTYTLLTSGVDYYIYDNIPQPNTTIYQLNAISQEQNQRHDYSTILSELCTQITSSNYRNILSFGGIEGIILTKDTTYQAGKDYYRKLGGDFGTNGNFSHLIDPSGAIPQPNYTIYEIGDAEISIQPNIMGNGKVVGLTEDAKAWAIIADDNSLIIGANVDLYANDLTHDNLISKIYMSITSEF